MIPEKRFARWAAIGVPLLLVGGAVGTVAIHTGCNVSWQHLLPPAGLFVALQIGAYLCAFWAGNCAREQGRFGPMSLLAGFSLWGEGYIVIHFGAEWGILPSNDDDFVFFSIFMALVTAISWLIFARFGRTMIGGITEGDK